MVIDGVEVGGGEPPPANAIVGSELVAMRSDLGEYLGWEVEVHEGLDTGDSNAECQDPSHPPWG